MSRFKALHVPLSGDDLVMAVVVQWQHWSLWKALWRLRKAPDPSSNLGHGPFLIYLFRHAFP